MAAPALLDLTSLLLCLALQASALTLSPDRTRFSRWDSVSLSCSEPGTWAVLRNTSTDSRGRCGEDWGRLKGSVCGVGALLPGDSGLYWCEGDKRSSEPVSISVHEHAEFRTSTDLTPPPSTGTPPTSAETPLLSRRPLAVAVLCHLLVLCPYVLSTVLMLSICRRSEEAPPPVTRDYDITAIATEYDF